MPQGLQDVYGAVQRVSVDRGRRVIGIAIAVLVSLAGVTAGAWRWRTAQQTPWDRLVIEANSLDTRPLAGQLSGGFGHRPAGTAKVAGDQTRWRLARAAAQIEARTSETASAEALRQLGIANLLMGKTDEGVRALEDAIRTGAARQSLASSMQMCTTAEILSDLSAAYLARAKNAEDLDTLRALNAAERAWELRHETFIAWNRALALSAVGLAPQATGAWQDFLGMNEQASWRLEANLRLARLPRSIRRTPSAEEARARLRRGLATGGEPALERAVRLSPLAARRLAEDDLLIAWARDGDAAALAHANRIGRALIRVSGDHLLLATAQGLDRTGDDARRAKQALLQYGDARNAYRARNYSLAAPSLAAAAASLQALDLPLSRRALSYLAQSHYQTGRYEEAVATCDEALEGAPSEKYPTLVAECLWTRGMAEGAQRRFDEAHASFLNARNLFMRAGDPGTAAFLDAGLLQSNYRFLGDYTRAWAHMSAALHNGMTGYVAYSEAAKLAMAAELPYAALAFLGGATESARRGGRADELADIYLSRAHVLARLGRRRAAIADFASAGTAAAKITDDAVRARVATDLTLTHAMLFHSTSPRTVIDRLRPEVERLIRQGDRLKIATGRYFLGSSHQAAGDIRGAEREYREALQEIRSQLDHARAGEARRALLDTARRTDDALILMLFDSGRTLEALEAADQSRSRLLDARQVGPARDYAALAARSHAVFLVFHVARDRVLSWAVTAKGIAARSLDLDQQTLERAVDAMTSAARDGDRRGVTEHGAWLYARLIGPELASIEQSRLLVVPDGPLARVPFAALYDRGRSRFLLDDRELAVVPSVSWYRLAREARRPPDRRVVIVPGPAGSTAAALPRLPGQRTEFAAIQAAFPTTEVLSARDLTPEGVLRAAGSADLLHFSGHAVSDAHVPSQSALVLTEGRTLTSRDLATTRLESRPAVILAACGTARGDRRATGSTSLADAFLDAGASAVVATLWPVRDDRASALSQVMYPAMLRHPLNAALREAQLQLRHQSPSDFDWAAFQCFGESNVTLQVN